MGYFSLSPHCDCFSIFVSMLCRSLRLCRLALCHRCPIRPSYTAFPIIQTWHSRLVPHVGCVVEPLLLVGNSMGGIYHRLTSSTHCLQTLWRINCTGVDPKSRTFQQSSGACWVYPSVEMVGWSSDVIQGTQKKNNSLCQHFYLEKADPPALTFMPNNSVPPICPRCHSSSPPIAGVLREWVQGSLWMSPLRGSPGTPAALHLTQSQSSLVFTVRSYGHFFSCHWNSGLAGLVWVWNPSLLRGEPL